jgi:hypothetical protein
MERFHMKLIVRVVIIIVIALFLALISIFSFNRSSSPNYGEQKSEVMEYLVAFNIIDNDLNPGLINLTIPSTVPQPELYIFTFQYNLLTRYQAGLKLTNALKPPNIDQAESHHESYKLLLEEVIAETRILLDGSFSKDNTVQTLSALKQRGSTMNRLTEALIKKFNISDETADYRFRGK